MRNDQQNQRKWLRLVYIVTLLVMALSVFSLSVHASNMNRMSDTHVLAEGDTIDGPGFFSGDVVQIDGTVNGTTFAAGQSIQVNGTINGSLFAAGQTVIINGEVTGNIYGAGQTITMNGQNEQDGFLAGATITVGQDAQIGRDLFMTGSTLVQSGTLARHLFGAGQQFTLDGSVGGDTNFDVEQLTLEDSATIEGDLNYTSPNEATIHPDATINGQTDFQRRSQENRRPAPPTTSERVIATLLGILWSLLSALLVWLLFKLWRSDFWMNTIPPIAAVPLKTMGFGLLALLVTPLAVVLLMITVIGIPLALILAALYAIFLYLSKIVVAVFIGSWLASRFHWENLHREIWLVLIGLVILELLDLIPFVGGLVGLLVAITGLGALILSHYRRPAATEVTSP